jgi:hypothetical protein
MGFIRRVPPAHTPTPVHPSRSDAGLAKLRFELLQASELLTAAGIPPGAAAGADSFASVGSGPADKLVLRPRTRSSHYRRDPPAELEFEHAVSHPSWTPPLQLASSSESVGRSRPQARVAYFRVSPIRTLPSRLASAPPSAAPGATRIPPSPCRLLGPATRNPTGH